LQDFPRNVLEEAVRQWFVRRQRLEGIHVQADGKREIPAALMPTRHTAAGAQLPILS
jgi:hypothetical protein